MKDVVKDNIRFIIVVVAMTVVLAFQTMTADSEPVNLRCEYPVEVGEPLVIERDEYDPSNATPYAP